MENTPPLRRTDDASDLEGFHPTPDTRFDMLDPVVRLLWFIGRFIFWTIVFLAVLVYLFVSSNRNLGVLVGLGALALLAVLHLIWPFISYRHWGYAIRQSDFLIRSGVLWKRISAIPFARIQHVDNNAGPIERAFGVSNLVIHTAGSQMGSMRVPGLPAEHAESLRDYLSEVGHTHANI